MGTIFVSHSEKDLPLVDEIIRGLERQGSRTWFFERDVLPGTSYLVQIHDAVDRCDAILLDMTPPQLKERQPERRHALGGTAMISAALKERLPA